MWQKKNVNSALFLTLLRAPRRPTAGDQQQSVDAAVLHLLPPHRQLLCPQHVRRRGGGELPQVPPAPRGGGGQEARGEAPAAHGKEEEK